MVVFYDKYDFEPDNTKEVIEDESKTIPSEAPFIVALNHIPRNQSPSTVSVSPGFTETSDEPEQGEFRVRYSEGFGLVEFNSANAGANIQVSYNACGTVIWAETHGDGREGINYIQDAIKDNSDELDIHSSELNDLDPHGNNKHNPAFATDADLSSTDTDLNNHVDDKNNPHELDKSQIDLGNVRNVDQVARSGDTMQGMLHAQNNSGYTTMQMRNIYVSTSPPDDAVGGNGDIWLQIEE